MGYLQPADILFASRVQRLLYFDFQDPYESLQRILLSLSLDLAISHSLTWIDILYMADHPLSSHP